MDILKYLVFCYDRLVLEMPRRPVEVHGLRVCFFGVSGSIVSLANNSLLLVYGLFSLFQFTRFITT